MIWNPWRRIGQLEAALHTAHIECAALERCLSQSADRYDRIRQTNAALREALDLYRETP